MKKNVIFILCVILTSFTIHAKSGKCKHSSLLPEKRERKKLLANSKYGILNVNKKFNIDSIVIDDNAVESIIFAAHELQYFILKAMGKKLAIKHVPLGRGGSFFVGRSKYTDKYNSDLDKLKEESFLILKDGQNIIIAGNDEKGPAIPGLNSRNGKVIKAVDEFISRATMHGVYTFLENYLNIRWYWPGLSGTVVPRQTVLQIPDKLRLIDGPAYNYRLFHKSVGSDIPGVSIRDYLLWGVRNKAFGSVGFLCNHATSDWQKRFGKTHPEWFALEKSGVRDNINKHFSGLCYSEPAVLKQSLKDIDDYFSGNYKRPATSTKFASASPNDGRRFGCYCKLCIPKRTDKRGIDGSESDIIWGYVKDLADGVKEKHPDLKISCIAYNDYTQPPQRINLPDNVIVQLTTGAGGITLYNMDKDWNSYRRYRLLDKWLKRVNSVYLWTYFNTRHRPEYRDIFAFYPFHLERFFAGLPKKVKGIFAQVGSRGHFNDNWIMDHLTIYLGYRLMWNPKQKVMPILEEYYKLFYGPAAIPMADFYTTLAECWHNITKKIDEKNSLEIKEQGYPQFKYLGDSEAVYKFGFNSVQIKRLENDLADAIKLTPPESIYRVRINLLKNASKNFFSTAKKMHAYSKNATIAYKFLTPPVIDGKITDAEWHGKSKLILKSRSKAGSIISTKAFIAYDENNLYVAFDCAEPDAAVLKRQKINRNSDKIWLDDSIELFLTPSGSLPFHLVANFGESIIDSKGNDISWNSHATAKTSKTTNGWQAEISIPWSALGLDKKDLISNAKGMTVNFNRHRPKRGDNKDILWEYYLNFGAFSNVAAHGSLILSPAANKQIIFKDNCSKNNGWKAGFYNYSIKKMQRRGSKLSYKDGMMILSCTFPAISTSRRHDYGLITKSFPKPFKPVDTTKIRFRFFIPDANGEVLFVWSGKGGWNVKTVKNANRDYGKWLTAELFFNKNGKRKNLVNEIKKISFQLRTPGVAKANTQTLKIDSIEIIQ